MARAEIHAGICGFSTTVETRTDGMHCTVSIDSDCELIRQMAGDLQQVDPFQAVGVGDQESCVLKAASGICHAACPVPVGIVKAVEVETGLALSADVHIKLSKT